MKLKACDTCLVYGSDKKPLCRARVVEVEEDRLRLFFGSSKLRRANLKTLVDFYDGHQGLVRCLCELRIRENMFFTRVTEPWMADCALLKVYEAVQRQKDLRVKVNIRTEFMTEGRFFYGIIQNISAGGLFFVTMEDMIEGQFFYLKYRFKNNPCEVRGRVLRKQELPRGGFGYGCQFVGTSLEAEADIRNFVYVTQIEKELERQKELEAQDGNK